MSSRSERIPGSPTPSRPSPKQFANERNPGETNQYGVSIGERDYAMVTADSDVSSSQPAILKSITVTVATATDDITIRDANTAGTGTVIETIPSGTAKGTVFEFDDIRLNTGLFVDYAATATGTLRVAWRQQ